VSRTDSAAPPEANPRIRRPARPPGEGGPGPFVRASVVMAWRWMTRMRTALYLLGLLALLTLVATVVPQQPNVPGTVEAWLAGEEGPGAGVSRVLGATGAFDVYGSAVFLALLLLLFLSLTACLVPRIRAFVRLVRRSQPPLVRSVGRTDVTAHLVTDLPPVAAHAAAADLLRARRWRVRDASAPDAPGRGTKPAQVAAETGLWTREGGSLLFHLSFYVLLTAIVLGQLLTFEGQRGLVEGEAGFVDTEVSYWSYRPGRWWGAEDHRGWRMDLDAFHVDWIRDPLAPGAGQPTTFRSEVTITPPDGDPFPAVVDSNRPLTVDGMKIHQLDWGYSPRLVVEVDGEVVHDRFLTAQLGEGGAFYRTAVKAPGADPDVGIDVFLYPFAPDGDDGRPQLTGAPWDDAPVVIVSQYRGDLRLGETQQTINELDTSGLELVGGAYLRPGDSVVIEGVVVSFPELRRWVGFQVSSRPQIPWLLFGSALLVGGLVPALYAYRRRLWVLASPDPTSGRTLLVVAGRAFQRPQAFEEEHARLVTALAEATGATPAAADDRPRDPAPAGSTPR
jgi:cytochrome c biogenesis protein